MLVRRFIPILSLAVALIAAAVLTAAAAAQSGAEHVELTPAGGTLSTRLVFAGSGFTPGLTVSVRFYPPDGVQRRVRTEEGAEVVWVVQPDGTFSLDLVPAQQFPTAAAGHWYALFCAFGSPTCQQIDFDLAP